jgi:hypothetical protein
MNTWALIQSIAPTSLQSRLFGVATVEQAAMIMLKGHELGLGLAASFEFIDVIQGKPGVNPKGALALIQQSGLLAGMKIENIVNDEDKPWACKVWMKRTNGFEYTSIFTMDDAKRAGLIKPDGGWDKYPANMLRWRAIGYCADIVFPDVIGGMLRPEELGATVSADGDIIESTATIVEPEGDQKEPKKLIPQTLADLLTLGYLPDGIMAVSTALGLPNPIPATPDEVAKVFAELMKDQKEVVE